MKKIIIMMAILAATTMWAQETKYPVEVKKLPHLALNNLKAYFPDVEVAEAYTTTQKIKDEFVVVLANSTMVVFDKHGQWSRVDANEGQIPDRMVDGRIKMNLTQNKLTSPVIKMAKDKKGNYEVTLQDGTVLNYDNQFKPITQ